MVATLSVNEIFYSIQGEGRLVGIPQIFVRLAGCNLVNTCGAKWCDTKYALSSGEKMDLMEIVQEVEQYASNWVCITGGEPLLQPLEPLIELLRDRRYGRKIHIETNGTLYQAISCDNYVVSPKRGSTIDQRALTRADEIKVVIDDESALQWAKTFDQHGRRRAVLSVQPEGNRQEMTDLCVNFVKENPDWRISTQLHKLIQVR